MKKAAAFAIAVVFTVALSGMATGNGDAAKGKAVSTKRCGTCHGPEGEPKEAVAKMMKVVTAGQGKMKGVTGLSDVDVADLVAFMRTLAKK